MVPADPTSSASDFRDLPSLVAAHARARPEAPALCVGDETLDWRSFDALVDRAAAALQRGGLAPRGCVALCASSSVAHVAVFVGALRAGAAVAPLPSGATALQLAQMAADAGATQIFVDAGVAALGVPWPEGTALMRLDDGHGAWLAPPGARPDAVRIAPDWAFNLIYSSGTTGTPKGIVQPHAMRWAHIQRAALSGYGADTVTLLATPLYSNTTLVAAIPTLAHGGCLVLMPKFDALGFLRLAQAHRATHTMLVPVQYQRLLAAPEFDGFDLTSFRFKFSTSAPFHAELKAQVLARWPGGLVEYYGLTEGGGTCMLEAHRFPDKLHTVGRPVPGHDIRLIDDAGREIARRPDGASVDSGEVVGRSPGMMSGYHGRPDLTAEAEWYDDQGRRYIRSGDIGRFDDDGFLVLHDRRKDMLISGGFNIYPSDLEAVLRRHPAVAEAAVVGAPSAAWGETPVAFIVRRDGHGDSAEALRDWANAQLGKTQRLAGLRLVDTLPRSAIGKVLKRALRETWTDPLP